MVIGVIETFDRRNIARPRTAAHGKPGRRLLCTIDARLAMFSPHPPVKAGLPTNGYSRGWESRMTISPILCPNGASVCRKSTEYLPGPRTLRVWRLGCCEITGLQKPAAPPRDSEPDERPFLALIRPLEGDTQVHQVGNIFELLECAQSAWVRHAYADSTSRDDRWVLRRKASSKRRHSLLGLPPRSASGRVLSQFGWAPPSQMTTPA